ncbi:MAG: MFS transporter [Chloroflexi bacterium]|nr:MFS transporter [Chloroflexota bacterium]
MQAEITNVEKMARLRWAFLANAANSVFVSFTFFGPVFILFVSQLGFTKTQIGFLFSLFPFFGLIAPFIAPRVARFGYKRTYLTFWGARKVVAFFLIFTPWVFHTFGSATTLIYIASIILIFAVCRAIAETGIYPWEQEFVPSAVRGKYAAMNNIFSTLTNLFALAIAGIVIQRTTGVDGFMWLIAAGVIFGFTSVWASTFVPGGAAVKNSQDQNTSQRDMGAAVRDKNFLLYLGGAALVIVGTNPLSSFLPLFMQEEVGLSAGNVVLLQTGTVLGGLLSSYIWGWAADRYSSKPVALSGLSLLALLPIFWIAMPHTSPWNLYAAMGIAVIQGLANMGWGIGSSRLLFVNMVPPLKKSGYMALYYAWIGIVGGLSQISAGGILDSAKGLSGHIFFLHIDPYFILFAAGLILPILAILFIREVHTEGTLSLRAFAAIFLRGNPFRALATSLGYHRARDERTKVSMTGRLGEARSPLVIHELLEALEDPRFNVRFEAILSATRFSQNDQIVAALIRTARDADQTLSSMAAWALGRIGAIQAIPALQALLASDSAELRATAARALGTLEDHSIIPRLDALFDRESNNGVRVAYATVLGKLRSLSSTEKLLWLLQAQENRGSRNEVALALARMIGNEHYFVTLWKQTRTEPGTAFSLAVTDIKRKLTPQTQANSDLLRALDASALAFARGNVEMGIRQLREGIILLAPDNIPGPAGLILSECASRLDEWGAGRIEYLLLCLHTLSTGLEPRYHHPVPPDVIQQRRLHP